MRSLQSNYPRRSSNYRRPSQFHPDSLHQLSKPPQAATDRTDRPGEVKPFLRLNRHR